MKRCSMSECNNSAIVKGYCDKHYRRFKKYGDAGIVHKHTKKKCLDEECERYAVTKGYCDKHYRRVKKSGTSKLLKIKPKCSIEGCTNKHLAKSLCYTHYWINAKKAKIDDRAIFIINNHDGKCDICRSTVTGYSKRSLNIDHDHKTGMVRGLLCHKCNIGLGNFNDNIDLLQRAIFYLKR